MVPVAVSSTQHAKVEKILLGVFFCPSATDPVGLPLIGRNDNDSTAVREAGLYARGIAISTNSAQVLVSRAHNEKRPQVDSIQTRQGSISPALVGAGLYRSHAFHR